MTAGKKNRRRAKKRVLWIVSIMLTCYVVSYCILSHCGNYVIGRSGRTRFTSGFAFMDVVHWQPKYVWGHLFYTIYGKLTYHSNTLGILYAPLVILDQKYVHKTYTLEEFEKKHLSKPASRSDDGDNQYDILFVAG